MKSLKSRTMISLYCIIVLSLVNFASFGQYKFILNLRSTTLDDSKIHLSILNNINPIPLQHDSAYFKNGFIKMEGQLVDPSSMASLAVVKEGKYLSIDFVIDSGENNVNLEVTNDVVRPLKLMSNRKSHLIYEEIVAIHENGFKPIKKNDSTRLTLNIFANILDQQIQDLKRHPSDFASVLLLYRLGRFDFTLEFAKRILATLECFDINLRSSPLGKKLYEEKTELIKNITSVKTGKPVLNFIVNNINNTLFDNNSLKGYNYLIVFSATWCVPCQKQLPNLKKLYLSSNAINFKIVYFNLDDDLQKWEKHVKQNKIGDWINVSEKLKMPDSKIDKQFGVYSIPAYFLVDKEGIILYSSEEKSNDFSQLEMYMKANKLIN